MTNSTIADAVGEVSSGAQQLFRLMQALQDAIVFRRARASSYCHDCEKMPGGRCDDHACDLNLIVGYERDAHAISAALDRDATRIGRQLHR